MGIAGGPDYEPPPSAGGAVGPDIEADTLALNAAAINTIAGLIVQAEPTRVSIVEDFTQSDTNEHYQVVSVWDKRTIDVANFGGSSGGGDANGGMRIICEPELTDDVTAGYYTGLMVSGFIGDPDDSGNDGSSLTKATAVHTHWDILRGDVGTLVGFAAHLGLIAAHADTAIGFEVQAINQIGGTYDNSVGFRMNDTDITGATTTWGFQIGNHQSRHRGKLGLGGANYTDAPTSQLEVTNFTEQALSAGSGAVWMDMFDFVGDFATGSGFTYHRRFLRGSTANGTQVTWGFGNVPTTGMWIAEATIVGRRSNGAEACAYRLYQVNHGSTQVAAGTIFAYESTANFAAALVNVFGVYGINITGLAAGTVYWYIDFKYWVAPAD